MQDLKTLWALVKLHHITLEYPHQRRRLSRPSRLQQDQPERRNNSNRMINNNQHISSAIDSVINFVNYRNGLAKQLSKLLVRQESDYHLWKFQQKLCSPSTTAMSKTVKTLRLKIESLSSGNVHSFAHCRNLVASSSSKGEGSLSINKNNRVSLVFTPERWERFNNVQSGDIVSIYEPWWVFFIRTLIHTHTHTIKKYNQTNRNSLFFCIKERLLEFLISVILHSLKIHLSLSLPPPLFERRANSKRQSMELVGGVTLLLDFNLCKKVHQKKKEVSKLSNVSDDGRRNDIETLEDLADAADGRACSSAIADSIAAAQVAQNRRPSTVTVLQTWTCPCQGKISFFFYTRCY